MITKRDVPAARLVPIKREKKSSFGWMQGTVRIKGDIIAPIDGKWDTDAQKAKGEFRSKKTKIT